MDKIKISFTGFPSPARDYGENSLDLNSLVVSNPCSTFFLRVEDNFEKEGIKKGDIIVVDTSIENFENKLIVAEFKGELVIGRVLKEKNKTIFVSKSIKEEVSEDTNFEVFGVITFLLRKL
ncbi:MAG: S24 family peptidase [Candidatus Hydrothermales bacterium]